MGQNSQTKIITSQRENWPLSFRCPEDWKLRRMGMRSGVKFFLQGPRDPSQAMFASITVRARPSEKHTAIQLAREWIEDRSAFRTFRILARTETHLAGIEAVQIDAAHDVPLPLHAPHPEMVAVQERVILAACEGVAYQLTYRFIQAHFEEHLPTFEDLVASFSLERQQ